MTQYDIIFQVLGLLVGEQGNSDFTVVSHGFVGGYGRVCCQYFSGGILKALGHVLQENRVLWGEAPVQTSP